MTGTRSVAAASLLQRCSVAEFIKLLSRNRVNRSFGNGFQARSNLVAQLQILISFLIRYFFPPAHYNSCFQCKENPGRRRGCFASQPELGDSVC